MRILYILMTLIFSTLSWGNEDYKEFQALMSKTALHREAVIARHDEIELALNKFHILTGKQLETINLMAIERFNQQENTMAFVKQHSLIVEKRIKNTFIPNPIELKSLMMALALGVTLGDNHLLAYQVFESNPKLRRLLNEYDQSYEKQLNMMRDSFHAFYSLKNRKKMRRAIFIYQKFYLENFENYQDDEFIELSKIIESSSFYQKFKIKNPWTKVNDLFNHLGSKLFHFKIYAFDIGNEMIGDIIYAGSKIFGNTLGAIQFRPGKLKTSVEFIPTVKRDLQVLDILMERTPARATSNFIPGFWTHTAIYVGGEDDLKFYGVWDHPVVKKYHGKILKGANTIEALRSGVKIDPIETFRDADTFAAIRFKEPLSYEQTQAHLIRAFSQIDKIYDFSFDIERGNKIVCSELHYITYIDIPFNTSRILGRQTISIDQIAEQALSGRYFNVTHLWVDGKKVVEDIGNRFDIILLTQGRVILTPEEEEMFAYMYDLGSGEIHHRSRANPISSPSNSMLKDFKKLKFSNIEEQD